MYSLLTKLSKSVDTRRRHHFSRRVYLRANKRSETTAGGLGLLNIPFSCEGRPSLVLAITLFFFRPFLSAENEGDSSRWNEKAIRCRPLSWLPDNLFHSKSVTRPCCWTASLTITRPRIIPKGRPVCILIATVTIDFVTKIIRPEYSMRCKLPGVVTQIAISPMSFSNKDKQPATGGEIGENGNHAGRNIVGS